MVLYNVTIVLEPSIKTEWETWMKTVHIPDVMATGFFLEYKMSRVIDQNNPDDSTYAIQYLCKSMEALEDYQKNYSPKLQAEHTRKYNGKFGAFRTLLKVLSKG